MTVRIPPFAGTSARSHASTALLRVIGRLRSDDLARGAGTLALGTAVGQGLVLLATPLLTRLYTPADFGVLAVYASLLAIIAVVATLKYDMAIVVVDHDDDAVQLVGASLLAGLMVGAVALLLVLAVPHDIARIVGTPAVVPFLILLPVSVVLAGFYQTFSYWALRRRSYRRLGSTKVAQSGWMVLTQSALGLARSGPLGLILGDSLRWGGGSLTLIAGALRQDRKLFRSIRLGRVREQAARFRRFPMITAPSALANSLGQQLPPLLIAGFYGAVPAGAFFLIQKVLAIPITMLGRSMGDAYIAEFSAILRAEPARALPAFHRAAKTLFMIGVIPAVVLVAGGRALVPWALGDQWAEAGVYLQIVSLMFLAKFVVNPLSNTLVLLQRQGTQFAWDMGRLVLVNGAIVATAAASSSARAAVGAYAVAMLAGYLSLYILMVRALRRHGSVHDGPTQTLYLTEVDE